ncbi:LamG-like jellyroll fold domain-containing protein [Baaleninema sp.]|uniref:LamG-like jellyroll fold domain-containing protein n=1 Tax=Baaleninema sp. TaxID=3101197 RepID=UPI003D049BBD
MSAIKTLFSFDLLESFKESHPDLNTVEQILSFSEERFVEIYQADFNGDARKARQVYREAERVRERVVLLWANIKDTVASLSIRNGLFNNIQIPESFIRHQQSIPSYDRIFGNLDYLDCDACRSIFGPAAYFVDLLRFIETHIPQEELPRGHALEERQPRLFQIPLDCDNTYNLIPYIDLVNEVLEDILRNNQTSPYEVVEAATFPMTLPFHLPLEEIRLYLKQLKLDLQGIYRLFGVVEPEIAREMLALSPREYATVESQIVDKTVLDDFYGVDTDERGEGSIEDVSVFLQQTGLSREELNQLLFLDLSNDEILAGLSRLFFINKTGDGEGYLYIEIGETFDRLVNLTALKLDRIYRFLKLSRKLGWSFTDLDWGIRTLQGEETAEKVLRFDGINDFVSVANAGDLQPQELTLEAWVLPVKSGVNPIVAKGSPDGLTQFLFWITPQGKLGFFSHLGDPTQSNWQDFIRDSGNYPFTEVSNDLVAAEEPNGLNLIGERTLSFAAFSHVAVTVNQKSGNYYQLKFYINGVLDSTWSLDKPIPISRNPQNFDNLEIRLGKDFNNSFFTGQLTEVRIWNGVLSAENIAENRFKRCHGRESNLIAYWPLVESPDLQVRDYAVVEPRHPGILGGDSHHSTPIWVDGDLALTPLPRPISTYAYHFNGRDNYVGGRVENLDSNTLTLEAWVSIQTSGIHPILYKGDETQNQFQYALWINAQNQLVFSSSSLNQDVVSTQEISLNTLTHVAATVDASGVTLYLNGTVVGSPNLTVSTLAAAGDLLYLGRDFSDNYLHGVLQEVRIWNRVRSEDELRTAMHHHLVGTEPGLVAYWRLDEPNPQEVQTVDRTFNFNHLSPGGILETYQPQMVTRDEVILPNPVRETAYVLNFAPNRSPVKLQNPKRYGLGHWEQFSLQFWFKAENPDAATPQLLFSQGDREIGISVYLTSGNLVVYAWCAAFGGNPIEREITLERSGISANQWHYFTLIYDETAENGIAYRFYLNGDRVGEITDGFRLDPIGNSCLGGLPDDMVTRFSGDVPEENYGFSGQISDLRIWQIAISEEDITNPITRYHHRHIPPHSEENLLGYFPMTEDYGRSVSNHAGPKYVSQSDRGLEIPDRTPNRLHGNLYVGPDDITTKWQDAGSLPVFPDTVLKLANSQFVRLPNAAELDLIDRSFTLEIWLRVSSFVADLPILSGETVVWKLTETGEVNLQIAGEDFISTSSLNPNQWHHLAWRYDNATQTHRLFVDGTVASEEFVASGIAESELLNLGASGEEIAEFRVWKTPRTEAEIQQFWNQTRLDTGNLTARWIFDRDPRKQLVDRTQNAYSAVIETNADIASKWVELEAIPAFTRQSGALVVNSNPGVTPDFIELSTYSIEDTGTLELWLQFRSSEDAVILDSSKGNAKFFLEVGGGFLQFTVSDTLGVETIDRLRLPQSDNFHHVAIAWQFDATEAVTRIRLSVNDIEASSQQFGNGIKPEFATPYLALNQGETLDGVKPFHGAIAQLRGWNLVPSHAELQRLKDADLEGTETGLVTYLPFDEATGTKVRDVVSGETVQLKALSVLHPDPQWIDIDRALELDGLNDRIEIDSYTPRDTGTIELWLKFSPNRNQVLFDASVEPFDKYFILDVAAQKLRFRLEDVSDADFKAEIDLSRVSLAEFTAQWHHVVVVWEYQESSRNVNAVLYLDDRTPEPSFLDDAFRPIRGEKPDFDTLYVGHNRSDYAFVRNNPLQGQLRHLRIWDRMLSAEEIQQLQQLPWQGVTAGLLVDLPLEEGSGTTLGNLVGDAATLTTGRNDDPDAKWVVVDRALELVGSETFIDAANVPPSSGSIELWTQFSRNGSKILFDASSDEMVFRLDVADGQLGFSVGGDDGATLDLASRPDSFEAGWHHIAVTWEWDSQRQTVATQLYLDDGDNASYETTVSAWTLQSLYLGISRLEAATLAGYRAFDGSISQVRLWNRVVSLAELRRLRYADLTGTEAGLLLYLPIKEGSGNRLQNLAGGGDVYLKLGIFAQWEWLQRRLNLFRFDGDRLALPPATTFGFVSGDFTLEAWVNLADVTGSHPIVSSVPPKLDPTSEAFSLAVENGGLRLTLEGRELVADDLSLSPNTWHHVVCRYADGTFALSVDGQTSAQTLEAEPVAISRTLYFGVSRQWDTNAATWQDRFFRGFIDEIRVWETVRSDAELQQHRDRRLRGDENGLITYWIFSDAQHRTLFDAAFYHKQAYLSRNPDENSFVSARPPLYTARQAPVLEGYNDYIALPPLRRGDGGMAIDLTQPHTVEFWFADEPQQWQHLAAVYGNNGEISQIYHNGVLETQPSAALTDKLNAYFANASDTEHPDRVTSGQIAELRLWQGVRTAEEIQNGFDHHLSGREPNLCGYWRLDDSAGRQLKDTSESLPPATLVVGLENTAEKWQPVPPPLNGSLSALYFDGKDDRVILSDVTDLKLGGDFTVEAWVKLAEPDGFMPVLGCATTGEIDNPPLLNLGVNGGKPGFSFDVESTFEASPLAPLSKGGWGGWHHLTWQYDATAQVARIFVDGEQVAQRENVAAFIGIGEASIGYAQQWDTATLTGSDRYFHGWIGEVRIWQTLRTPEELRQNWNRPLPASQATLAALTAYWIFDDRADTIVLSRVSQDNNRYQLFWTSDPGREQPIWTEIDDYPILRNPLPQQALSFDGTRQYLATADFAFPEGDFTLEAWIRVDSLTEPRSIAGWREVPATGDISTAFELRLSTTGNLQFEALGSVVAETQDAVELRMLTHVAIAVGGNRVTLYIDTEAKAEGTFDGTLQRSGLILEIGRGFSGLLQNLRVWEVAKTADTLRETAYSPVKAEEDGLVAAWPLATTNTVDSRQTTPNAIASPPLELGGLRESRKPTPGEPTAFLDARRSVLTLPVAENRLGEVRVPAMKAQQYEHRALRSIEIWFLCENPNSAKRQILYAEGDRDRGLSIYIQSGKLYFEGVNRVHDESGWKGSRIATERIQPRHWHHAALILDGRSELRDDAFCALLDGRVIDKQPGSQLWGTAATLNIGGLQFTPSRDGESVVDSQAHSLNGQIAEVRIWEAVRSQAEIRENLYGLSDTNLPELLFFWNTSTGLPLGVAKPMLLPDLADGGRSNPTLPLVELACLHQLKNETDTEIDRLTALWSNLKHTGVGDGETPYDNLFNSSSSDTPWTFAQRLSWDVYSTKSDQREIRTRLMSSLRVSSQDDLLNMVAAISGEDTATVVLDGRYLTHLYRIRLLSRMLDLSISEVIRLRNLLELETQPSETPLNGFTEFTIRDVLAMKNRSQWMQETGIDLSEYEFLVYDRQDSRVSPPFTDADVIDSFTTLLDRSRGFLLSRTSFVSEEVSEAASSAIYDVLQQRGDIDELTLYIPSADGSTGDTVTVSVVLPGFVSFTKDDLAAVTDELNWLSTFVGLAIDLETLQNAGLIDDRGMVLTENPLDYSVDALSAIAIAERSSLATSDDIEPEKLVAIRDLLDRRRQTQTHLPTAITTQLQTLRQGLNDTISLALADLLDSNIDRLSMLLNLTTGETYDRGTLDVATILTDASQTVENRGVESESAVAIDLDRLYKTLFLLQQFDLSDDEIEALLRQPQQFGLQAESLVTPSYSDLDRLHTFVRLKTELNDPGNQLAGGLSDETRVLNLTGWSRLDIETLIPELSIEGNFNTIPALNKLAEAFQLVQTLGADVNSLIDLAKTDDLSFSFYQRHATALFNLVRSKYDENQWPTVYKPLHNRLAVRKRDSLTAVALEQLSDEIAIHKTPEIFSDYLLIDIQTGSEVETSRIVQATASLQLYVQRGLTNLERGVNPEEIPVDEWEWMKNYRVWEANRKVFLYPENYIEPELRDTKTELFEALESELQQNEVTQETVTQAYTRYLDKFAEVTNLTIIGSYLDTEELPKSYALKFDGTQHFTVQQTLSTIAQQIPQNFTIEMWVKPDRQLSDGGLIGANNWDREQKGFLFRAASGSFRMHLSTQDDQRFRSVIVRRGFGQRVVVERQELGTMSTVTAPYTANRWHHVAATYNGSELRLYVNGELKVSVARSGNIFYPNVNDTNIQFALGAEKDRDSLKRFIGEMRDVRIWNTARSQSQIQNSMVFGISNPQTEANLLYDWKMTEGSGTTVEDFKGSTDLQLRSGIDWTTAPNLQLTERSHADAPTTLYLIGRNDNTQEHYFRRWIDRQQWEPWQKIDLTINASYVAPVFAFNKLFLFWAEIPDSVRAEDRKWVNNNSNGKPVDQNGEEIVLRFPQVLNQTLPNGRTISTAAATLDTTNGGSLSSQFVYSDKHDVIEQVNVTVKTPVIKYSYYNFSKTWVQPQTLEVTDLEGVELEDWQQRQPKWQRVYAQRWRESDVAPPVQQPSEPLTSLDVAQLGPNSYAEEPLPSFSTHQLSVSFWLRVRDFTQTTTSTTEIPTYRFTLFSYDGESNNPLTATLTHTPSAIDQKPEIMTAVNESQTAFAEIADAIAAIERFRRPGTLLSLDDADSALTAQRSLTDDAADAISNRAENAKKLANATVTAIDNAATAIDDANTAAESNDIEDIADLASSVATVATQAVAAAEYALLIANSSSRASTALENAKTHRDTATTKASDAQTAASTSGGTGNDTVSGGSTTVDTSEVDGHTDAAIQAAINCLTELQTVLEEARSQEATVPKYQRGDLELKLQVGTTEKTVLSSVNYDTWQQVVFILNHNGSRYTVTSYIYEGYTASVSGRYAAEGTPLTFTGSPLASAGTLQIGDAANPRITPDSEEALEFLFYEPLMSEFRVWNYLRSKADIEAERFQRKHGREFGLELHLPLDSQSQLTRVSQDELGLDQPLSLEQVFAPSVPESTRERILLVYGDVVQTLRNNLKDIGYQYTLLKNSDAGNNYSLSLAEPQSGAIVGIDDDAKIAIEDYVQNEIYPLDRFRPQDRIAILDAQTTELSSAITEWNDNTRDLVLLNNRDGGTQLNITESYILDVHNQPGWFVLDIGDEIFLVQTAADDWRVQTAEERLRSSIASGSSGGGTQKQFDLYFDRDFALETGNSSHLQFNFIRLNTFAVQTLSEKLFGEGIDGLLSLDSQNT